MFLLGFGLGPREAQGYIHKMCPNSHWRGLLGEQSVTQAPDESALKSTALGIHSSFKPGSFALIHWYISKPHQPQWKDRAFHLLSFLRAIKQQTILYPLAWKVMTITVVKLHLIHHIHYQLLAIEPSGFSWTHGCPARRHFWASVAAVWHHVT